ncbi:DUF2442 domain-containing protein [Candidatus Electronema halotolerans]|jgi:hypothetical protein
MKKLHEIGLIEFSDKLLKIEIDGKLDVFRLEDFSPLLANASELERMTYEVSPFGYGIHWPLLDEDISIDSLLGIVHHPERQPAEAGG